MSIKDLSNKNKNKSESVKVRMIPPPIRIPIKEKQVKYNIKKNDIITPIDFNIDGIDITKYQQTVTEKTSLSKTVQDKKTVVTDIAEKVIFNEFTLVFEITRFFPDTGALKIEAILENSISGIEKILEKVNDYNEVLYEEIIPKIFNTIYKIDTESSEVDREIVLLKKPEGNNDYYEFYADPALVANVEEKRYFDYKNKSFHASHYCFDSKPELECFLQFLLSKDVKNIYFTGMFTDKKKTEFVIGYIDPESHRYRNYYPDFLAIMKDGSYQIIEIKGDNKLDDSTVKAKQEAAKALTTGSDIIYRMIAGSNAGNPEIVDPNFDKIIQYPLSSDGYGFSEAADSGDIKNEGYY
jgi:hypothetical protein